MSTIMTVKLVKLTTRCNSNGKVYLRMMFQINYSDCLNIDMLSAYYDNKLCVYHCDSYSRSSARLYSNYPYLLNNPDILIGAFVLNGIGYLDIYSKTYTDILSSSVDKFIDDLNNNRCLDY